MAAKTPDDTSAAVPPCPICGKPSSAAVRPFCSKRCADIDLHRWLGGVYVVHAGDAPADPVSDRDDDEP